MGIQLLVDNKNGNVFDISELVTEATWKTARKEKAGSLEFEMLKTPNVNINNGDVISFKSDNNNVFYGYVFDKGGSKEPTLKVTAYDQLRYLLYNDTYAEVNKKASYIITKILNNTGLRIGNIEDTQFVIPTLVEDDKKLLDIIYKSLESTLLSTGQMYVLYDDFGSVCLNNINSMRQDVVISDDSNLSDYEWKDSIDSDTYNVIKLVRDNKETKGRDVHLEKDSNSISKWGKLQYFKKVDEKMDKAKIQEMLTNTLKLKNKETKTLKLKEVISTDITEDLKLRAGSIVYVEIKEKNINQFYLIEEATHKFSNGSLLMDFDLRVV